MRRGLELVAVAATALLLVGCQKASTSAEAKPLVGGLGRRLVAGSAGDLRLSRDGAWATFLKSPVRPSLEGVNPDSINPKSAVGELVAVSLATGEARSLAKRVANRAGATLFSPDGRWLLFVTDFDLSRGTGTLMTQRLDGPGEPEARGQAVSFVTVSPDGRFVAFIDGGVLKLALLEQGSTARTVAADISTAKFALGSSRLLALRRGTAGGALLAARTAGAGEPSKLAERVADYELSADGRHVAFTQASTVARDVWDLFVSALDSGAPPVKAASGVGSWSLSQAAWYVNIRAAESCVDMSAR